MLPAYFASAFQNRRVLVAMTFLFAAGVATIVLPIALGAAALRDLLLGEHAAIFVAMGRPSERRLRRELERHLGSDGEDPEAG